MTLYQRMAEMKVWDKIWIPSDQANLARDIASRLKITIQIGIISHTISVTRTK